MDAPSQTKTEPRASEDKIDRSRADWYKDAVIYQLHVKAFFDANDDGIGDFAGLIAQLDYIAGARRRRRSGCCRSTPRRCATTATTSPTTATVNPAYGTMRDFTRASSTRRTGAACASSPSWSSTTPPTSIPGSSGRGAPSPARRSATSTSGATPTRSYHGDARSSSSTPRSRTGPGTRWPRPISGTASTPTSPTSTSTTRAVLEEVLSVMHFWLDMGVDGLRLDAIPYLVEREGTNNENLPETHDGPEADPRRARRALSRTACCWPRPTSGRRTRGPISATATNATWRSTSR